MTVRRPASRRAQRDYPFYFAHRDDRGDLQIGKRFGPDMNQILKVDGPHSAPSEHYVRYNTVMVIGAGIGMTPCASILAALLRYRWRRSFGPEVRGEVWRGVARCGEVWPEAGGSPRRGESIL